MGQINPFTGAIPLPSGRTTAERVRHSRANSKDLPDDEATESVVEDPDAVVSIGDGNSHQSGEQEHPRQQDPADESDDEDGTPHRLDITA
jgi:hypothetical protein